LTNTLNATGRIKTTLKLMIMWTTLTWIFTPIFIYFWGFNGVAPAAVVVAITVVLPIWLVKKITDFSLWDNVGKSLLGALIMGGVLYLVIPLLIKSLISIALVVLLGGIIYSVVMLLLAREKIIESLSLVLGVIKK